MDEKTNFIVYCIEEYKAAKGMNGESVINLFNRYCVIDYIRNFYESLHTTGRQYIIDDISMYIESNKEAESDPFYSPENIARLKESIAETEANGGKIHRVES